MANTNIHYYAGFLMLFFVIVVLPVVVVALVGSVRTHANHECNNNNIETCFTYFVTLDKLTCAALRCVAHKSRKQTEGD